MHIGLLSPGWPVNEYPNGIATYVHAFREQLIRRGHRVTVFAKSVGRTNADAGIRLVEPTIGYRFRRRLFEVLHGESYDVLNWGEAIAAMVNRVSRSDPIHVLEMEESFGWCADVQKRISCPVVVKLHGPAFLTLPEEERQSDAAITKIKREGDALRQMPVIIAPSHCALSETLAEYKLRPPLAKVIPNPIDVSSNRRPWSVNDCERNTILFVGRFDSLKGGDIVLKAFHRLLALDNTLRLIFVGPDRGVSLPGGGRISFAEYRDSLFSPSSRARIEYCGQLPRSDIAELRRRAMVTLVASRWENQGYTALEAMIQGCPLVSTRVGGLVEVIENGITGYLADPADASDLCEKVWRVLRDPGKAREIGANAREFARQWNCKRAVVSEAIDVYEASISMVRGKPG